MNSIGHKKYPYSRGMTPTQMYAAQSERKFIQGKQVMPKLGPGRNSMLTFEWVFSKTSMTKFTSPHGASVWTRDINDQYGLNPMFRHALVKNLFLDCFEPVLGSDLDRREIRYPIRLFRDMVD